MSTHLLAVAWPEHLPIILVVGLAVVFGTVGASIFQRLRIPQVVGTIVIGLVAGRSVLGILDEEAIAELRPFTFFALGVIGFMVGGELRLESFRKYGRSFTAVLLAEGLGAFVCVGTLATVVCFLLTGHAAWSAALGIVLGAISSATAPAATVDVLWEYKTRGVLTTTVFAIVALDDGLALVLFALASAVAGVLMGRADASLGGLLAGAAYELLGAVTLGVVAALVLNFTLRRTHTQAKALPFTIGSLALVIGMARLLGVDLILSTMALGACLTNLAPRRSRGAFETVESVAPPIYVLFFVLVGAQLYVRNMAGWMWVVAAAYVVGRTAGKMLGAYLGARWGGSADRIRKYLGLCLFSQAGVAIGLAILAGDRLGDKTMGAAIATIITATTFLVQIIGPPCVKLAVSKAGEVGLNVTAEDLLRSYTVGDVVDRAVPRLQPTTALPEIVRIVGQTDVQTYPVLGEKDSLAGVVTLEGMRRSLQEGELAKLLVAFDLMEQPPDPATEKLSLAEAVAKMDEQRVDFLPVVSPPAEGGRITYVGLLERRAIQHRISEEILRRRQQADA